MKKIFFNFQILNLKYSRCNLFCKTFMKSSSVWCVGCKTLNTIKSEIDRKTFRCLHMSVTKFNDVDKKLNEDPVIYYGTLTGKIKAVKVFSLTTSVGGIIGQAWILQNASVLNNLSLQTFFFISIGFFTYITPLFIHYVAKKYITEIRYDSTSDTYTATFLSFFLRPVNINFKREDIYVPTYQALFTTMNVKGRPVLISSDCFFDEQDYIKMMGYDKPIDLRLTPPPESEQKTPGGSGSDRTRTQSTGSLGDIIKKMSMIPILPRDIVVPPSVLKRRFAICTVRVPVAHHFFERRGGISIDRSEHGLLIKMVDPCGPLPARAKRLSHSDWLLLETLDTRHKRSHHTGRFLTMHKRRRKRLITRSLTQDHALLDDIHHGQVQCVLDKVNQWPFNAFILDNVTGGRSLPVLCVHLFHWYGLLDYFKLDVVRCWKFFSLIEEGYHSTNPYHNSVHATDVTQAMHCFLQEKKIKEHLTPLEIMASLIAAVTHDLDHPGVNQPFLIATSNHLAALYENSSVLENHHWRSAIGCLLESHVAEELEDCRPELQRQISSLILATDITRQQEFLVRFKRYLDQDLLDMKLEEHRHFILQIALKCADISNPCRPWEVSKKWSQKVCEEFFRQGDYERQLNLPVTALCDRQSTSVPKIQAGFFTFVVYPLFEEWHRFLGDGLSDAMMKNLHGNKLKWDALILQENAEGTNIEVSEDNATEDLKESSRGDSSYPSEISKTIKRTHFLTIPESGTRQKVGRRHSVPLSLPEPPVITRTITRRESLAIGENKCRVLFSSGLLMEEEEEVDGEADDEKELTSQDRSSPSLMSYSGGNEDTEEGGDRRLSSENLLPEPSITSITTVTEASRLSNVLNRGKNLQRSGNKSQLTRQQTFPPLQTCFRQRYFSTTAEMSRCSNAEIEQLLKHSSNEEGGEESEGSSADCNTKHGCRTPPHIRAAILKESNRSFLKHGDCDKQTSCKREIDGSSREKGIKVAKLLDEGLSDSYEKENLDPRGLSIDQDFDASLFTRSGSIRKNSTQGLLSRRRGSAPVGSEVINPLALALRGCADHYPRRGSVPVDAIRCSITDEINLRIPQDVSLSSSQQHCPYQRRGSIPADAGCPETGKPRNRNKKTLRRRSSGGPEMFCFSENGNEKLMRKKEMLSKRVGGEGAPDSLTTRRRGSLPIDVLLATHSGDHREAHDS